MKKYTLVYSQPYEYDDDSPSGIGDHAIGYQQQSFGFIADSDSTARQLVKKFLDKGFIVFDHPFDGDGKTYYRKLVKFTTEVEVF